MFRTALQIFSILGFAFSAFILYRNDQVYKERKRLLLELYDQAKIDIRYEREPLYLKFFEDVPYNDMVFQFWKPVKSFYEDYEKKL